MPLCSQRTCGCAIQSSTLSVTGSGTTVDPWKVEFPVLGQQLPYYHFADIAARNAALPTPLEGQLCWIDSLDEEYHYTGSQWKIWYRKPTAYTVNMSPSGGGPPGFTNGNATQQAQYQINQGLMRVSIFYKAGSTTSFGDGTGFVPDFNYPVLSEAPVATAASARLAVGSAFFLDVSASVIAPAVAELNTSTQTIRVYNQGGPSYLIAGNSVVAPFTWAVNDEIMLTVHIPLA